MDGIYIIDKGHKHVCNWKIRRFGDLVEIYGDNRGGSGYFFGRQYLIEVMDASVGW
jgi:hypothetical protein